MNCRNAVQFWKASLVAGVVLASATSAGAAVLQSSSTGTPKWLTITYTAIGIAVAASGAVWAIFKFFFHAVLVKEETIQALKNHGHFFCDKEEDIRTIGTKGQFLTAREEDIRTIRERGQFLTRDELVTNPWIVINGWKDKQVFLTRDEVFSRKLCAELLDRLLFELASDPSLVSKLRNALEDRSAASKIPESSPQDQQKVIEQLLQTLKMLSDQSSKKAGAGG